MDGIMEDDKDYWTLVVSDRKKNSSIEISSTSNSEVEKKASEIASDICKEMKTFEAQEDLNENRTFETESISYQCESFDFKLFTSRELVQVSLGEKVFECFISSLEIPMLHGLTRVEFIPFERIK